MRTRQQRSPRSYSDKEPGSEEAGNHIGHLLGQPPNDWKHQDAIESSRQWQSSQEVRRTECSVHHPACSITAAENEYEAHRDEAKPSSMSRKTRPRSKSKRSNRPLAAREPPQQRRAAGVDERPIHWQPWLSVMPWSRRRSQGEDGSDNGLRSHGTS